MAQKLLRKKIKTEKEMINTHSNLSCNSRSSDVSSSGLNDNEVASKFVSRIVGFDSASSEQDYDKSEKIMKFSDQADINLAKKSIKKSIKQLGLDP